MVGVVVDHYGTNVVVSTPSKTLELKRTGDSDVRNVSERNGGPLDLSLNIEVMILSRNPQLSQTLVLKSLTRDLGCTHKYTNSQNPLVVNSCTLWILEEDL